MVFHNISSDIKERAIWLLDHDYIPEDVASILGVSRRSIGHWTNNIEEFGTVVPPPNPNRGRP